MLNWMPKIWAILNWTYFFPGKTMKIFDSNVPGFLILMNTRRTSFIITILKEMVLISISIDDSATLMQFLWIFISSQIDKNVESKIKLKIR